MCSLCGKSQDEVRTMVSGPTAYVRDGCITLCHEIVMDDVGPTRWLVGVVARSWGQSIRLSGEP
jgi:ATP-dependent protease Clp ATPase subunit